jgi:ribosome-binding factor A
LELSRRTDQVGEAIRESVAEIIARGLKDPRIGFVTITRVEVTPDLRTARVLFSVLGDQAQKDKTRAGLQQAAGFIRREIGRRIQIRYTPELQFHYDAGIDATDRVARILQETQASEGRGGAGDPDAPEDGEDS